MLKGTNNCKGGLGILEFILPMTGLILTIYVRQVYSPPKLQLANFRILYQLVMQFMYYFCLFEVYSKINLKPALKCCTMNKLELYCSDCKLRLVLQPTNFMSSDTHYYNWMFADILFTNTQSLISSQWNCKVAI